jgi:hypothetical protein
MILGNSPFWYLLTFLINISNMAIVRTCAVCATVVSLNVLSEVLYVDISLRIVQLVFKRKFLG